MLSKTMMMTFLCWSDRKCAGAIPTRYSFLRQEEVQVLWPVIQSSCCIAKCTLTLCAGDRNKRNGGTSLIDERSSSSRHNSGSACACRKKKPHSQRLAVRSAYFSETIVECVPDNCGCSEDVGVECRGRASGV